MVAAKCYMRRGHLRTSIDGEPEKKRLGKAAWRLVCKWHAGHDDVSRQPGRDVWYKKNKKRQV
jgi:hypothetical protein